MKTGGMIKIYGAAILKKLAPLKLAEKASPETPV